MTERLIRFDFLVRLAKEERTNQLDPSPNLKQITVHKKKP